MARHIHQDGETLPVIEWATRRLAEIAKDADFSIRFDLWEIRRALLEDEHHVYRPPCAYTYCTHTRAIDSKYCDETSCPKKC